MNAETPIRRPISLLLASPLVDRWLACSIAFPPDWVRLRGWMAAGLGLLTLGVAAAA